MVPLFLLAHKCCSRVIHPVQLGSQIKQRGAVNPLCKHRVGITEQAPREEKGLFCLE